MSKHYPIYRSMGIWYVILYSKTILAHASIISTTTCMSIQSGGFLPLGMEGQMISPTAIIPQGSLQCHISPLPPLHLQTKELSYYISSAKFKFRDGDKETL